MEQNKLLNHVAARDGMTNLYEKEHFQKLTGEIIEDWDFIMQHAMMFVDIDNFKY